MWRSKADEKIFSFFFSNSTKRRYTVSDGVLACCMLACKARLIKDASSEKTPLIMSRRRNTMFNQWLNLQPAHNVADSACRDFLTRSPRETQSGTNGNRFTFLAGKDPAGVTGDYRAIGAGGAAYANSCLVGGSLDH